MATEVFDDYYEHTNADYPVGVYYVDLRNMFMEQVRSQYHEAMELDLMRSGSATITVGDESFTLDKGGAVWINSERLHSIRPAGDGECVILSVLFRPAYLFENEDSFLATKYLAPLTAADSLPYIRLERRDPYGRRALECVDSILEANLNKAYGYELETKSMLCALWLQLLEKSTQSPKTAARSLTDEQRVKEAIEFIREHFSEQIRLEDIADSIHVSKSECCRAFKRCTGEPPFDHLLIYRVFEAARRMQRSDPVADSMQRLSAEVGFNNVSYFNRIFRKFMGLTPTKYREIIKKSHRDALNPYGISLARL
ncbi:MAG: helix-turn-helix domain-containing protein [Lachnospiraceae bacterium]|nr:helix-turn-helix domain-containing protein [Lachnospiraceae bacterium]